MAKMNIERSVLINKKPEEIYPLINNFDNWSLWSPWDVLEDNIKNTVRDDKKYFEWEGDITGSGNMTITDEKENQFVNSDLLFLKPWKSKAKVGFTLKAEGDSTRVMWWMEGKLPFFLFFMKKMMEAAVGMDFVRGLNMLKDLAETGKVHSRIIVNGQTKFDACNYIGIKTSCAFNEIPNKMEQDFAKLMGYCEGEEAVISRPPMCIYHEWDIINSKCTYTACIPLKDIPADLPAGFVSGSVPSTAAYSVIHMGAYKHLGNAWGSMQSRLRSKKFKANKKIHPMEVYLDDPSKTTEEQRKTEIIFATK